MKKKAEYRSAVRSRKMIRRAFIELLSEKDISKITVTDIVNRAELNRTTFYAHYADVRAVMEEIENETVDKIMDVIKEVEYDRFFQNPEPLVKRISGLVKADIDFYKVLMKSSSSGQFLDKMRNIYLKYMYEDKSIPEEVRSSKSFPIQINFFAGGIVTLYRLWFAGELDCSLDDISTEIAQSIKNMAANW